MKLQVNLRGSWRDVISFDSRDEHEVRSLGGRLAYLSAGHAKMRIADDQNVAQAYCDPPLFTWRPARNTGEEIP